MSVTSEVLPPVSSDKLAGLPKTAVAKLQAAYAAVDAYVRSGQTVGIGSGSTVVFAVQRIAELVEHDDLHVVCVPTSFQAKQLIQEHGLVLGDLNFAPCLDVAIDGADELDVATLDCIKGGGGCLLQEKIVASCAERFVIIADESKESSILGSKWKKGIPLEVVPLGYVAVMNKLTALGGHPKLRMAAAKAGPCVTDNGNFIVDVDFQEIENPKKLEVEINMIPGVVDCGLFVDMACQAFIGREDGTVRVWSKK